MPATSFRIYFAVFPYIFNPVIHLTGEDSFAAIDSKKIYYLNQ